MESMAGLLFWTEKCLEVRLEGVQRGYHLERRRKVIPCRGAKDGQPTGTAISCTVLRLSLQRAICLQTVMVPSVSNWSQSHVGLCDQLFILST